jgi:hypothetical protein
LVDKNPAAGFGVFFPSTICLNSLQTAGDLTRRNGNKKLRHTSRDLVSLKPLIPPSPHAVQCRSRGALIYICLPAMGKCHHSDCLILAFFLIRYSANVFWKAKVSLCRFSTLRQKCSPLFWQIAITRRPQEHGCNVLISISCQSATYARHEKTQERMLGGICHKPADLRQNEIQWEHQEIIVLCRDGIGIASAAYPFAKSCAKA